MDSSLIRSIDQLHYSRDWKFLSSKQDMSIYCRRPFAFANSEPRGGGGGGATSSSLPPVCQVDLIKGDVMIPAPVDEVVAHLLNPLRKRSKKDPVFDNYIIEEEKQAEVRRLHGAGVGQLIYRAHKMPWPLQVCVASLHAFLHSARTVLVCVRTNHS